MAEKSAAERSGAEKAESLRPEMAEWRRHLHRHPELAFREERTSALVAERLESFGVEVHRGIARTGVVGVLRAGDSRRAIALRADMDALPLGEETGLPYASVVPGVMHACGHDGHVAMLLGAARLLAESRPFAGTVVLLFQPAEENGGGARLMVEEGLFDRFPVAAVYGLHNAPGLAVGKFALRAGPILAAVDSFEVVVTGKGTHSALPHAGVDPVVVAAEMVTALQTVVARALDPLAPAVVSVTTFHAGDAVNVTPERAVLGGSTRAFDPAVEERMEAVMRRIVEGVAAAHGAKAAFRYERGYPVTVNARREAEAAAAAARDVAGSENVVADAPPVIASEDFAFYLAKVPGAYAFIGNGAGEGACMVHNPRYDFNDDILALGARYWVRLVERELPANG